ncbi:MAG: hypothetical protein CBB68_06835 [Rhodospirillaceae bacterium TMED8]|nr:MAG: hypothetical protein CBB68_06835 [Rhodospirillaceae bacterium TMED8]
MHTISKILTGNLFWIIFFLFVVTSAQARNEYLQNGTNTCAQGSFDVSIEQREDQYNYNHYSPSNNYENTEDDRSVRLTWRKYLGTACTDEFIAEQEKQMKIKTQLEVIKECKRVPRISPPPPEFAELINMCMKVGVMSTSQFVGDRDFDPKVSYWTELKNKYMEENPDIVTLDNYKDKK